MIPQLIRAGRRWVADRVQIEAMMRSYILDNCLHTSSVGDPRLFSNDPLLHPRSEPTLRWYLTEPKYALMLQSVFLVLFVANALEDTAGVLCTAISAGVGEFLQRRSAP